MRSCDTLSNIWYSPDMLTILINEVTIKRGLTVLEFCMYVRMCEIKLFITFV